LSFEIGGIKPSRIVHASSEDLNCSLKDGQLAANGQSVGLPWGIVSEVELTHEINVFGVAGAAASKFTEKYPFFSIGSIPKGTYRSNKDYDVPTINIWSFVLTHKELPEDFVYEVVKKTYENVNILIATHKSAEEVKPGNIVNSTIPLHPGAIKYYREVGIKLPERLIP
jgi:TRAP transporter TAXI family solute receptor